MSRDHRYERFSSLAEPASRATPRTAHSARTEVVLGSFEATRVPKWRRRQIYQLVVSDKRIACVHVDGTVSDAAGRVVTSMLWKTLGPIGEAVAETLEERAETSAAKRRAAGRPVIESTSFDWLVARDPKNNFQLNLEEIDHAEMDKLSFSEMVRAALKKRREADARLIVFVGLDRYVFHLIGRAWARMCKELLESQLTSRFVVAPELNWLLP